MSVYDKYIMPIKAPSISLTSIMLLSAVTAHFESCLTTACCSPSSRQLPAVPGLTVPMLHRGRSMRCVSEDFWFLNTCAQLRKHFPCQRGCAVELGKDIPNYVVDAAQPTHQKCLITQVEHIAHAWSVRAHRCNCVTLEVLRLHGAPV